MEDKVVKLTSKGDVDVNIGGKVLEKHLFYRDEELPEFTEEEAKAIKNIISNRSNKPSDKLGTVLLLGTGGDPSALHEAKKLFMDDKKFASDYIVAYDPVKEGVFSMGRTELGDHQEWGVVMKPPSSFMKIEGHGTVLWNKIVKLKNRLKKRYK